MTLNQRPSPADRLREDFRCFLKLLPSTRYPDLQRWTLRPDEVTALLSDHARMVEALKELEDANEALCAKRSLRTYDALRADGCEDELLRLDRARAKARAALSGGQQEGGGKR